VRRAREKRAYIIPAVVVATRRFNKDTDTVRNIDANA